MFFGEWTSVVNFILFSTTCKYFAKFMYFISCFFWNFSPNILGLLLDLGNRNENEATVRKGSTVISFISV